MEERASVWSTAGRVGEGGCGIVGKGKEKKKEKKRTDHSMPTKKGGSTNFLSYGGTREGANVGCDGSF